MDPYQLKYLITNIKHKSLRIINQPSLFELYYNEYLRDFFFNTKIKNYIFSHPKCGRTWLYEILNHYSYELSKTNFINNRKMIKFDNKFIKFTHDCSDPNPYPTKSTKLKLKIKSHNNIKKIILLRDPREVIVSYWYQIKFRERTYSKNISEFIDNEYFGIKKIISFYNLLNSKIISNFKVVTYNDLVKNTTEEIEQIIFFLNLKVDSSLIKKCVTECEFKKLQKRELLTSKKKNIETMKFRKSAINNFKNDLNKQDLEKINNEIKNKLNHNYKKILNLEDI